MKKIFFVSLLLVSLQAQAQDPIRAEGVGFSKEQARYNAFREAVQKGCPSAVLSDREVKNYDSTNYVTVYNGCVIRRYETIEEQKIGREKYKIVLDAWLVEKKYPNRLIIDFNESYQVDGDNIQDRVDFLKENKKSGQIFLDRILRDFPEKAFTIKKQDLGYSRVGDNHINLVLKYKLIWNQNYLDSLDDALATVSDGKGHVFKHGIYNVKSKRHHIFHDRFYPEQLAFGMSGPNLPMLRVIALDMHENIIYSSCSRLTYYNFYSVNRPGVIDIVPRGFQQGTMNLSLPSYKGLKEVRLEVVPIRVCKL